MHENLYQEGMKVLEEMLGEEKNAYVSLLEGIQEGLGKAIVEELFGKMYRRKGLDLKTRQLMTIVLLIDNGNKEQLLFHTRCALNLGITKEEIIEAILHSIIVLGLPKPLVALRALQELF